MPKYCEHCHLMLAPHDPEKIAVGNKVFHKACFKKHLATIKPVPLHVEEMELRFKGSDR